jgi:hypothetical protein
MYGIYDNGEVIARFIVPLTVKSNVPIFVSDTLSLNRPVSKRSAQRWEIEANVEPLSLTANSLFVNLVTKGHSETVTVKVPQNYAVIKKNTATGVATIATAAKDATSVAITGISGVLSPGTMVTFESDTKVYMISSSPSINGEGTYGVFPPLRKALTSKVLTYKEVIMQCTYDTDTISGMTYSDGILMSLGSVKLIEALS